MTLPLKEPLEVQQAYAGIAAFFSAYSLAAARRYLREVLTTATSDGYWQNDPSQPLYFLEKLQSLVEAALLIQQAGGKREEAILSLDKGEAPDISNYLQYCGWHYKSAPWYFFPRHLNKKEYANPYRAFKKLAAWGNYEAWSQLLKDLLHYTLSTLQLSADEVVYNPLALNSLLAKLLEAAHLVEVRAIVEVGGEKIPKWKGPGKTVESNTTTQTFSL